MTNLSKINISGAFRPKVLLAPLDWGLGHATRCIPIVKELLNQKCEVWIAASGDQKALLCEEFPFLRFVDLPGYNVKYGKNRAFTLLKIFGAIPKILIRIKSENDWLRRFLATERLDVVISDNRYGLHAPGLLSVFITHQLRIRSPLGSWADTILQRIHYRAIRSFSLCWIPDFEGANSLAGNLSHPGKLPSIATRYIGLLSRFERPGAALAGTPKGSVNVSEPSGTMQEPLDGMSESPGKTGGSLAEEPACDLLILLSGPEPQRTIFENLVLHQLAAYSGKVILVRGLPGAGFKTGPGAEGVRGGGDAGAGGDERGLVVPVGGRVGVRIYNHLAASKLNGVINEAGIVLCRAGYSTIMDLVKLGKRAILVPTPGQTEQEYLGSYLSEKGIALCRKQAGFSLVEALSAARIFPFGGLSGMGALPKADLSGAGAFPIASMSAVRAFPSVDLSGEGAFPIPALSGAGGGPFAAVDKGAVDKEGDVAGAFSSRENNGTSGWLQPEAEEHLLRDAISALLGSLVTS